MTIDSRLGKLFEMGYEIERNEPPVQNNMEEIMLKKKISSATLWKRTGISKQTMHAVLTGKMKPGIDFVLKVAAVLDTPVEELFSLNESAWQTLISDDGKSVLWDLAELELVERSDIKSLEDELGVQYWDLKKEKLISEREYESILEKALDERMDEEIENARKEKVRRREEKVFRRIARETIEADVSSRYPLRFQRVVKNIKPHKANQS